MITAQPSPSSPPLSNLPHVEPPPRETEATVRAFVPRESVRNALLDAVGLLIRQYGYRKTSVEDIAKKAGVSRATAYLYFANKEELATAWMARGDWEQLEQVQVAVSNKEGTARARIAAFLLARILIRFDSAQPYGESIDEFLAALRPRVLAQRDQHHEAEAIVLAQIIERAVETDEIAAPQSGALSTARLLLLGTNALLPYSLSAAQLGERAQVEARAHGLIALLLNGLAAPDAAENEI